MKTTTSPFGDKLTQDNLFNIQGNFVNVVVANQMAWGIDVMAVNDLVSQRAIYEPLYHKSQNKNTRTRADVAAHKLAAERYLKQLRLFWHKWIEDGDMPTEGKLLLGGDLLDTEKTPRGKINDVPYVKLTAMGGGDVRVRTTVEEDQTKSSMHPLADAVECRYILVPKGEMPPEGQKNAKTTIISKKALFIISCGDEQAGETFWGFFRWVNISIPANSGQWSNSIKVVIA